MSLSYDRRFSERRGIYGGEESREWTLGGAAQVGIGAEWFPVDRIGIGAWSGAEAKYVHDEDILVDFDDGGRRVRTGNGIEFTLLQSRFQLALYF
jgi:hypothetical protein